jgi:hypothetical protein
MAHGHYIIVRWLLVEGGASIEERDGDGNTVWNLLKRRVQTKDADRDDELFILLQTMVLIGDPPPAFLLFLQPPFQKIITRGQQIRLEWPAYREQHRAVVMAYCPLHATLQPLIAAYAAPTPEDMWGDGWAVGGVNAGVKGARGWFARKLRTFFMRGTLARGDWTN